MERLDFEARAQRAFTQARSSPREYRRRIGRLVLLGTCVPVLYVALLAAVSIALVGASVAVDFNLLVLMLGIATGATAWRVARGLLKRPPAIEGVRVSPHDAPKLHEVVRRVAERVGGSVPDDVYLVAEFTAWARETPRTGWFGTGSTTALGIGLPLLHAMDEQELTGILAHEFGHLTGRDGLLLARVNRLRNAWQALLERQRETGSRLSGIVAKFGNWYLPRLEAELLALERMQEIEADALARATVGSEVVGASFLRLYGIAFAIEMPSGWPRLEFAPLSFEQPPEALYRELLELPSRPIPAWDVMRGLTLAWHEAEDPYAVHPRPVERLRACGVELAMPGQAGSISLRDATVAVATPHVATSAASMLLGAALPQLTDAICRWWCDRAAPCWSEARASCREAHERHTMLAEKIDATVSERMEQAEIAGRMWGPDHADQALCAALALDPNEPAANFAWGCQLLRRNDPGGVAFLEHAARLEPALATDTARRLAAFHAWNGQLERARHWQEQQLASLARDGLAEDELATRHDDRYVAVTDPQLTKALALACVEIKQVRSARLAVKVKQHGATASYVLAIKPPGGLRSTESLATAHQRLMDRIADPVEKLTRPGDLLSIVWDARDAAWQGPGDRRLAKVIGAIDDAGIYDRRCGVVSGAARAV